MKSRLKRFIAPLAVMIVAAISLGGGVSQASAAANCTLNPPSAITFNGTYLQQTFSVGQPCVNVDMIEWSANVAGFGCSGFVDRSVGSTGHCSASPPTLADVKCGRQYNTFTGSCTFTISVSPWCPPQTPRVVQGVAPLRIHQKSPQVGWDGWQAYYAPNQTIWC